MSDLRFDPITGQWVAIAKNRLDRPMEFIPLEQVRQQLICPFCRGNEDQTPRDIAAFDENGRPLSADDDASSWIVRVIPNKFPSFSNSNENASHAGPYSHATGEGQQLLIIPSNRHVTSLSELNEQELHIAFRACQEQISQMKSNPSIKHAMLFMNCRSAAGASLGHIHLQLIGSPVIGELLEGRTLRNLQAVQHDGQSLMKQIMNWEADRRVRVIKQTDNFCIFCPYASRFAFQVWIAPVNPHGGFAELGAAKTNELSQHCRSIVEQFEQLLDQPAYNLLLHQAPFDGSEYDHWYVELFPRLTCAAGFEWGTDIWVNPVSPEAAARRLQ